MANANGTANVGRLGAVCARAHTLRKEIVKGT